VFEIIWEFQFDRGGRLAIDGALSVPGIDVAHNQSVQLLVCADSSLYKLKNMRITDICRERPFTAVACIWQTMITADHVQIEGKWAIDTSVDRFQFVHYFAPSGVANERLVNVKRRCARHVSIFGYEMGVY
jgi:hypothetical protein